MRPIENEILHSIRYFAFFKYAPTADEIYCFLKTKALKRHFTGILDFMVKKGVVVSFQRRLEPRRCLIPDQVQNDKVFKYTLGEYSISLKDQSSKFKISCQKIKKIERYIGLLSLFSQIRLIGLSGTVAMMNAVKDDDIDLFIITAGNRLFTGRFIALVLAQLMGLRRKYQKKPDDRPANSDKVCLNLFFDESDMKIPKKKQTEYVAHEVLQMKPVAVKGDVYGRFMKANGWVFDIFPNARTVSSIKNKVSGINKVNTKYFILNTCADWIEILLQKLQLYFIRRHQTKELITDRQLWFHPEDFGEKITPLRS